MNTIFEPIDLGMVADARNIHSARLLTDPQFEELVSICAILNREIHRTGSFIEKLGMYAFVVSLTQKGISANRAETILRDLFKGLFDHTLDQLRQRLLKNADELDDESIAMGVPYAYEVLQMIEGDPEPGNDPNPMPFHRAYAHHAAIMATQLSITDVAAKKIMSDEFLALEGRDFYIEGKQFEDRFYKSKVRTEKRQRVVFNTGNSNREHA